VAMVDKNKAGRFTSKIIGWRMWIQAAFLMVWLDPSGLRMHTMCSPVFHCYACPLATFGCPIGIIAQFGALHVFPFIAVGLLIAVGALFGTLICGWVCPLSVRIPAGPGSQGPDAEIRPAQSHGIPAIRRADSNGAGDPLLLRRGTPAFYLPGLSRRSTRSGSAEHGESGHCR